jgi:hypothetical protein
MQLRCPKGKKISDNRIRHQRITHGRAEWTR